MTKTQDKYLCQLTEKIYSANDTASEYSITNELAAFFNEIITRKDDTDSEDGIQAAVVIYPQAFAAKINELNGASPHQNSYINLTKYLNGNTNYLNDDGIKHPNLYLEELKQLITSGIQMFIRTPNNQLEMGFVARNPVKTSFQLLIIKKIVMICKKIIDKKYFSNIKLGMYTPNTDIDYGDFTKEQYNLFNNALLKEEIAIKNK